MSFGAKGHHLRLSLVAQPSDSLRAQSQGKCQEICAQSQVLPPYHPYDYLTDVIDVRLGASH